MAEAFKIQEFALLQGKLLKTQQLLREHMSFQQTRLRGLLEGLGGSTPRFSAGFSPEFSAGFSAGFSPEFSAEFSAGFSAELSAESSAESSAEFSFSSGSDCEEGGPVNECARTLRTINSQINRVIDNENKVLAHYQSCTQEGQELSAQVQFLENELNTQLDTVALCDCGNSLEKAQSIIKKLNAECESLAKELEKAEKEVERSRKSSRASQRTWVDSQKQLSEVGSMKATEKRLREELRALKAKFTELAAAKDSETTELSNALEQVLREKASLEGALGELEGQLRDIERLSREREQLSCGSSARITELEDSVRRKDAQLRELAQDFQQKFSAREEETQHWQKQAENVIRQLHSAQPASRTRSHSALNRTARGVPLKSGHPATGKENSSLKSLPVSQSSLDHLASQLAVSLDREAQLAQVLDRLVLQEGKQLKEALLKYQAHNRDQTEKLLMHNEELEQRLAESHANNRKLTGTVEHCRKLIMLRTQQREEKNSLDAQLRTQDQTLAELHAAELEHYRNHVLAQILPYSQDLLHNTLSRAHAKVALQNSCIAELRSRSAELQKLLETEKTAQRSSALQEESGLTLVRDQLGLSRPHRRTSSSSHMDSMDRSGPSKGISPTMKECVSSIRDLQHSELQLREKHKTQQQQLDSLLAKYNELDCSSTQENKQLKEQLRNWDNWKQAEFEDLKVLSRTVHEDKHSLEDHVSGLQRELAEAHRQLDCCNNETLHLQSIADRKADNVLYLERELGAAMQEIVSVKSAGAELHRTLQDKDRTIEELQQEASHQNSFAEEHRRTLPNNDTHRELKNLTQENIRLKGQCERAQIQAMNFHRDARELESMLARERDSKSRGPGSAQHFERTLTQKDSKGTELRTQGGERVLELGVKYLEDLINRELGEAPANEVPGDFSQEIAVSPALESSLKLLATKIVLFSQKLSIQSLRETHTYSEVCKYEGFSELHIQLNHRSPDLEHLSGELLKLLSEHSKKRVKKHRKARQSVALSLDHADKLVSARNLSDEIEGGLADKSRNVAKAVQKLGQLQGTFELARGGRTDLAPELLAIFQSFLRKLLEEVNSSLRTATELSKSLGEVTRSSPHTHSATPMHEHLRRSRLFRQESKRWEVPLFLSQVEEFAQQLLSTV